MAMGTAHVSAARRGLMCWILFERGAVTLPHNLLYCASYESCAEAPAMARAPLRLVGEGGTGGRATLSAAPSVASASATWRKAASWDSSCDSIEATRPSSVSNWRIERLRSLAEPRPPLLTELRRPDCLGSGL